MLISVHVFRKLLSTWHFSEKVNNKPFILSGFAVNSRFSWKHVLLFGSRTPFVSSCDWLRFCQSVVLCFTPNICFMNTVMQICQPTASHSACVTCANKKKKKNRWGWGWMFCSRPFPLCFQVGGAMCCTPLATARTQRPVLHAGSGILINLEDDSATLDDDSSTLIRNEATEPPDEWRGRKCASVWLMK